MSTLAEIEQAIEKLPVRKQRELLRHLNSRLGAVGVSASGAEGKRWPVPPPKVSRTESRRVARRIAEEFGRVETETWK